MENKESTSSQKIPLSVHIEYCGVCDYGGHCLALAKEIKDKNPDVPIICKKGRRGSFEITIKDKLIYSKMKTMALPDYNEVVEVVNEARNGGEIREIKGQQPINCAIS